MSSAAVVIGALRVNVPPTLNHAGLLAVLEISLLKVLLTTIVEGYANFKACHTCYTTDATIQSMYSHEGTFSYKHAALH